MRITQAEPTAELNPRWTSETGRWQVGVAAVAHGYRAQAGLCGDPDLVIDINASDNTEFLVVLLDGVIAALEALPESSAGPYLEPDAMAALYRRWCHPNSITNRHDISDAIQALTDNPNQARTPVC